MPQVKVDVFTKGTLTLHRLLLVIRGERLCMDPLTTWPASGHPITSTAENQQVHKSPLGLAQGVMLSQDCKVSRHCPKRKGEPGRSVGAVEPIKKQKQKSTEISRNLSSSASWR